PGGARLVAAGARPRDARLQPRLPALVGGVAARPGAQGVGRPARGRAPAPAPRRCAAAPCAGDLRVVPAARRAAVRRPGLVAAAPRMKRSTGILAVLLVLAGGALWFDRSCRGTDDVLRARTRLYPGFD